MKRRIFLFAILAFSFISFDSFAQLDERKPGIYAIVGEDFYPLSYSYAVGTGSSVGIGPVSIGTTKYNYKGETSGVIASDTFVLVIDPEKKSGGTISSKKFDCFHYKMTPDDMLILPLVTNIKKQRREYDPGTGIGIGVGVGAVSVGAGATVGGETERAGFEWERITDNSFKIKVSGLLPGEYGIVFRIAKLGTFNYAPLFGFTIPDPDIK